MCAASYSGRLDDQGASVVAPKVFAMLDFSWLDCPSARKEGLGLRQRALHKTAKTFSVTTGRQKNRNSETWAPRSAVLCVLPASHWDRLKTAKSASFRQCRRGGPRAFRRAPRRHAGSWLPASFAICVTIDSSVSRCSFLSAASSMTRRVFRGFEASLPSPCRLRRFSRMSS